MLIENHHTCLGDLEQVQDPGSGAPGNTAHSHSSVLGVGVGVGS